MKHINWLMSIFVVLIAITICGCKNYYNDTIDWADNLESELSIKEVQNIQPEFIEIDWKNPLSVDDQKWYMITKIEGSNDILGMSHFLVFVEDKYQYRESKK